MNKYKIVIIATVSSVREVEAETLEDAQEAALNEAPYAPGFSDYEFGEWDVEESGYWVDGEYVEGSEG